MKEQYDPNAEAFWKQNEKGFSGTAKEFAALCGGKKPIQRPRKIEMEERSVESLRSFADAPNPDESFDCAVHDELTRLHFLLGRDLPDAGDSFSLSSKEAIAKITALQGELAAKTKATKTPAPATVASAPAKAVTPATVTTATPVAPQPAKTSPAKIATVSTPAKELTGYFRTTAAFKAASQKVAASKAASTPAKKEFEGTGLWRAIQASVRRANGDFTSRTKKEFEGTGLHRAMTAMKSMQPKKAKQ